MDYNSVILVMKLISEVFGALKGIDEIIKRVEAGEIITNEEIEKAQSEVKAAIDRWNKPDEEVKKLAKPFGSMIERQKT